MSTFAELLTEYMARIGIGDAEMARRIGVSRLTLIRWKEGVTARPRYREDVLKCADLLRLTPAERDSLLLAAGFSPDAAPAVDETQSPEAPAMPATVDENGGTAESFTGPPQRRRAVFIAGAVAGVVVVVAVAALAFGRILSQSPFPVAAPGESLIVVASFVNYTGGQQGFNVRGSHQG